MDEVVETYLPNNIKINKFFSLPDQQKVKVIELGLSLFEDGINKIQYMNNQEWEDKMEALKQMHSKEQTKFKQQNNDLEERFEELIQKTIQEKKQIISEIKESESFRFNEEISHLKDYNTQLTDKLSKITSELHTIHRDLDDKYTDRLTQKEGFYEKKITELQERIDSERINYEKKIDTEKQKWENTLIRTQNSTIKGQDGESYLFNQLNLLFPKAEIEDTHKIPHRGDFIMREKDFIMMVENKNYSKNVQKSEVDKFYRDIDNPSNKDLQCAVFTSLHTGICNKSDYEFEVRNGIPILFLHNVQNDMQSIKLSVKFFKLILSQKDLDLSNKEIVGSMKIIGLSMKRNYTKQRNKLDKYHSEQTKLLSEQEAYTEELFKLFNTKY